MANRLLPSLAALGDAVRCDLEAEAGRISRAVEAGVGDAGEGLKSMIR